MALSSSNSMRLEYRGAQQLLVFKDIFARIKVARRHSPGANRFIKEWTTRAANFLFVFYSVIHLKFYYQEYLKSFTSLVCRHIYLDFFFVRLFITNVYEREDANICFIPVR